jgi:RHS repeat-associated protein
MGLCGLISSMPGNEVKNNLNNALLLPTNSSVLNATSNTGLLKLYRCQDGLYGYQYFKNGSLQLYTMYLRVPPVVQKSRHPYLVPVSVKLATGDTIVQRFVVNMIDPQYPSDTIAVQGSCDFDLAWSQVLHNVLLGTASARNNNMDGLSGTLGAENNCEQDRLNNAILAGKVKYANYVDSTKSALYAAFYDYIMQAADEHLWIDYTDKRFAYTLYNYDLAGNLIKTIPPMGVHPLDSASCVPIDAMRASNSFNIAQLPDHKKTSRYEYNSANQLVHEYTPDCGEKVMYYDAKGNLILSQNDKQRPKGLYTYCLYDAQNRIIETGEVNWMNCVYFADVPLYDANGNLTTPPNACACQNLNTSTWTYCMPSSQINFTDNAQFAQAIQSKPRTQVVITVYDKEFVNLATQPGLSRQSNLRNRVAASLYYPSYSAYIPSAYTHATHYSYDAAGNVNCLVQEFPELSSVHQQYKRIDYEFDLHSGKVNLLSYNRGYADQFYQRYSYDADNRIQSVETSHDGFIWKRDASYTYYQHGPLARISLGAQRVQGVDYAYTLQGWLKAINGSALDTNLDMGGDGKAGSITPQDAYGTSLNYFNNDYAAIGASNWNNVPQPTKNLYNGNIARQTTALSVFGALTTAYTYDQQNRIRQAQYGSLNNQQVLDFNNWYASAYTYDLDGNLQSLVRHNSTGALLDSFAYVYTAPNDHNKLSDVWDRAANLSGGYDDIKQSAAPTVRYLYDELGQLSKDQTSGTDTIQWNLYGKVSRVENKTQKWTLRYGYDATGQRVSKAQQLSSDTGKLDKNTYYVRDAAGTILSVYELQKQWHSGKYVLQFLQNAYAAIDPAVATGSGFSNPSGYYVSALSTLGVLSDPSFKQSIQTHIGSSMPAQSAGQVLSADAGLRQQFLSNQPAALLRALQAYSQAQSKYPIADALAMYMQNEPSQVIDKLLYALFRDGSQSDSVLLIRSNHLATLVPGLMQQFLRDYEIDTNTIARQQQLLKSVAQNSTYVNSYLLDTYNNEGITPLYAWLASTTSDSTQMLSDSLSDNIINTAMQYYGDAVASQQADQQQIDKSQAGIYAFANWWQGASDYINTISPDLLGSISYDSDPALAVNNYLNSSNGDINKLHEAVAASSDGAPNLQRLASLLQVNLSPTNITSPYVDVLKTQQMRLAEQPIYGSSRVGVASYWPGQYDAVWDYTTGTQDTLRLLGIKPWYSATLEGYKPAGSAEPYDNSSLGLASAAHLLGQKSYELSNHLGNVQATLSDKRYVQKQYYTPSDSLRKGYAASVSSLYDYYPFGMLMKERCTSDTATQSVYMSQVVYSPQYTTVNNAMTGASITSLNTTTQTNYNGSVNYFGQSASISKTLSNLQSGIPVSMKINLLYTNKPLYLTLQQGSTLLYSTTMNSSGTYSFNFTPTQSAVQLSIAYSYFNTNANTLCFTLDSVNYTQQNGSTSNTQLVQISSKQSDKYRFGFNGQEKDNEIAGVGNHYDMGLRMYDTRLVHFPVPDPYAKKFPYQSPYVFAGNNPIRNVDKEGGYKVDANDEAAYRRDYPLIMKYLSTQIEHDVANSTKVVNGLVQVNPNIQPSTVTGIAKWGFGPQIQFKDAPGEFPVELKGAAGYTEKDAHVIQLNSRYAAFVEKTLKSNASSSIKQAVFSRFYMTLIHETSHELSKYGKTSGQDPATGSYLYPLLPQGMRTSDEQGNKAEEFIWGTGSYKPFSLPAPSSGREGVAGVTSEKYQPGVVEGAIQEANKTPKGRASLPTFPTP